MAEPLLAHLALGSAASVLMAVGLLLMKSCGAALPAVQGLRSLGAVARWLREPVWLAGLGLQTAGFGLYLFAVAGAPISMLAVMMQGGIGVFVVLAVLFLGERASRLEWIGITGVVGAMVLLGLSLGGESPAEKPNLMALMALSIAAAGSAAAPYVRKSWRKQGVAPAIASGIATGMGSVYPKLMIVTIAAARGWGLGAIVTNPWVYLTIAANVTGLVLLQNSFHYARGVIAMPLSAACSNLTPILAGVIALGERLPPSGGAATLRLGAFALTVIASGLLAGVSGEAMENSLA